MKPSRDIQVLIDIMARLRNPDGGCPWDLEQDFDSIKPHTIEEAYEVAAAIENKDFDELRDELGDLLFQPIYYAQMAHEEGKFDFGDIVYGISDKLIRRHPHVFGDLDTSDPVEVKKVWDASRPKNALKKRRETRVAKSLKAFLMTFRAASLPLCAQINLPSVLPALVSIFPGQNKQQKNCTKS